MSRFDVFLEDATPVIWHCVLLLAGFVLGRMSA